MALELAVPVVLELAVPVALELAVPVFDEEGVSVRLGLGLTVWLELGVPDPLELTAEEGVALLVEEAELLGEDVGTENTICAESENAVVVGDHTLHAAAEPIGRAVPVCCCNEYASRGGGVTPTPPTFGVSTHSRRPSEYSRKRALAPPLLYTGVYSPVADVVLDPTHCHCVLETSAPPILPFSRVASSAGGGVQLDSDSGAT